MLIVIPDLSLVLLVGPSGCGKSTFARRHFRPTEIVSSDFYRGVVADDEGDQGASGDAFDLVHQVVEKRLRRRRFTVIDATNLQPTARKPLIELARRYHYLVYAIAFDYPEALCQQHNTQRPDRVVPERVIRTHATQMPKAIEALEREGVRRVHIFRSPDEANAALVERVTMRFDRRALRGPFDFIGDVHGCLEELLALFERLDYRLIHQPDERGLPGVVVEPPTGRMAVFVGDLGDRGPDTPGVYRVVMGMVRSGTALCVLGNHDNKLLRKLRGNEVSLTHGLALSMEQLDREPPEFRARVLDFLEECHDHYLLDGGRVVVAHAGLREDLQGRASGRVRSFALFGDTTGESDEVGLPVRLDWAAEYKGPALVVYGHTPVAEAILRNNTINIDTGCVFGGKLTALRFPERETVSVPSLKMYCEPKRPFLNPATDVAPTAPARLVENGPVNVADLLAGKAVETRLLRFVPIRDEMRVAVEQTLQRMKVDPRWLVYLPPAMAPVDPPALPDLLEHPGEAFDYFRTNRIESVIAQELHPGTRVAVIVCREEAVAKRAFGVESAEAGVVLARTGGEVLPEMLARLRAALTSASLWERLGTDWVLFDALLVGAKLAPIHLLATAGKANVDRPHAWHMTELANLCLADPDLLKPTGWQTVALNDSESIDQAIRWWHDLDSRGGAGLVIKPTDYVARGARGIVQPALKARTPSYLRSRHGPDYLTQLRQRDASAARGVALRQFALGVEALERFTRGEPLRRVLECVLLLASEA